MSRLQYSVVVWSVAVCISVGDHQSALEKRIWGPLKLWSMWARRLQISYCNIFFFQVLYQSLVSNRVSVARNKHWNSISKCVSCFIVWSGATLDYLWHVIFVSFLEFSYNVCRFYCNAYYAEQFRKLRKHTFTDGEERWVHYIFIIFLFFPLFLSFFFLSLLPLRPSSAEVQPFLSISSLQF